MEERNAIEASKYSLTIRILHWVVGILIIGELIGGFIMTELQPPFKFIVYGLHKSFGVLIGFFVFIRILNRLISNTKAIPAFPSSFAKLEKIAAKLGIALLYIMMIMMPISGLLMSMYSGYEVPFFGITLPMLVTQNAEMAAVMHQIHISTAPIFGFAIIGHVAFTFKHLIIDKVNLMKRIV